MSNICDALRDFRLWALGQCDEIAEFAPILTAQIALAEQNRDAPLLLGVVARGVQHLEMLKEQDEARHPW